MTTELQTRPAPSLNPRRHVRVLLVAFPVLYLLHGFLPDSQRLFVDEKHGAWGSFWLIIAALHFTSVLLGLLILRRDRIPLASIGLSESRREFIRMMAALVTLGIVLVAVRTFVGRIGWFGDATPVFGIAGPATTIERLIWIPMALTAGTCEEFVYRGLAIGAQRASGVATPIALAWSTVAFVFLHGFSAFFLFPVYFAVGLAMATIYLRTGRLTVSMTVHTTIDLLVILAS